MRRVGRHQETKSYKWLIRKSQELQIGTKGEYENLCNSVTLAEVGSLEELFQCIKLFEGHEIIIDISRHHFRTVVSLDKNKGSYNDHEHMDPYLFIHLPLIRTKAPCQIRDHWQSVLFDRLIEDQRIIPGLSYTDIAPISKLTLTDLQLYQDIQIFRGKLNSTDGIKQLTDEERLAAVRRLAERIPLKLAKKEAHDALSRMIARGDPYTKAGIRKILLPSLFYEQLKSEGIAQKKRINRTEWIKTFTGLTPEVRPSGYTLSTYWVWLKQGVQAALEKWVLESADKPGDRETKRATSPALLGVSYNEWGRIITESEEYDRRRKHNPPKVEIVYESDYDLLTTRHKRFVAIEEASPDEANFDLDTVREASAEVEVDDDAGRSLTDMTGPDVSGFEDELLGDDWLSESHLWQDLAHEIEVDPLVVTRTIKSDLTGRQKQYWVALSKIVHDEPDIKIQEARARVNRKLRLTAGNGRQIWDRLKHAAKVRKRNEYYDSLGIRGHALLRPDGTEMRVPFYILRLLQHQNLIIRGSRPPRLNRGIFGFLRNVCGPQKLKAPNGNYAALRILRTLGVDLSGPREVSCDCSRCRP